MPKYPQKIPKPLKNTQITSIILIFGNGVFQIFRMPLKVYITYQGPCLQMIFKLGEIFNVLNSLESPSLIHKFIEIMSNGNINTGPGFDKKT